MRVLLTPSKWLISVRRITAVAVSRRPSVSNYDRASATAVSSCSNGLGLRNITVTLHLLNDPDRGIITRRVETAGISGDFGTHEKPKSQLTLRWEGHVYGKDQARIRPR